MEFHNTSVCFVCSHLAAHQSEVDRRNQDYQQIMTGLQFPCPARASSGVAKGVKDHDMVFWVGDLNYRLNELDSNDIRASLDSGNYQQLFLYDQVRNHLGVLCRKKTYHLKIRNTFAVECGKTEKKVLRGV